MRFVSERTNINSCFFLLQHNNHSRIGTFLGHWLWPTLL